MVISVVHHFTSGVCLLNAVCDMDQIPVRIAHLKPCDRGGREGFCFRSLHLSSAKSHSHCRRLSVPGKDYRKSKFATDGWLWSFVRVVGYESRLGDADPHRCRKKSWSWLVSAKGVNSQNELQTAEDLREQLEALQQEAEQVRGRANSARLRFMRLTHVVEQLRQRAAMDVRNGKEDSARSLLIEKQKVMKALEASRQRAELLEQLAGKLNVAISMKETQLIAALSNDSLRIRPGASGDSAVYHVSPIPGAHNEEVIRSDADIADISLTATPNSAEVPNVQGNAGHNMD